MNKIDLTPLVGSQILCEFWDAASPIDSVSVGFLSGIDVFGLQAMYQPEMRQRYYNNCRIYHNPDYWISNADGKLVLPYGVMAASKTRDGRNYNPIIIGGCIGGLELKHIFGGGDIIAVQVIGPAEGWSYD